MFGNFGFGGEQRSFSFGCFHADSIPNAIVAAACPFMCCEMAYFQNDPDSTGNVILSSDRVSFVGTGIVLQPGDVTGWVPIQNLNLIWHKETDATTYLKYMVICCYPSGGPPIAYVAHLLLEGGGHLLLEDGELIYL